MSNIIARNITSSSISVSGYRVYSIDSTDVEVVIVENTSSHDRRNAFKYTENGTSYWYVVGINYFGWVSDLSTIGYEEYSPVPVLPTVTLRSNLYISPDSYNHQIGSGNQEYLYEYYNGSYRGISYDDTKKQCAYGWLYYPTGGPWQKFYYGVSAVNMSGDSLGVRNDTQNTINVTYILYAESSDPATTIITVYNSSNAAYNAFKYTINNIDYYYVLDETQIDWTDDLSSIGYSLYAKAWFDSDKSSRIITNNWSGMLYGNDGNYVPYYNTKTYAIHSVINISGSPISVDISQLALSQDGGAYMRFENNSGSTLYNVVYIEYTVS